MELLLDSFILSSTGMRSIRNAAPSMWRRARYSTASKPPPAPGPYKSHIEQPAPSPSEPQPPASKNVFSFLWPFGSPPKAPTPAPNQAINTNEAAEPAKTMVKEGATRPSYNQMYWRYTGIMVGLPFVIWFGKELFLRRFDLSYQKPFPTRPAKHQETQHG